MNTQNEAPSAAPFNAAPCVISSGNDFYVIYGLSNGTTNKVSATMYDGTWRNGTLNHGSTFPALMNNGQIKSILVGSTIYVVYEVSNKQLAVMSITGSENSAFITNYTTATDIGSFALSTDGVSLYVATNEAGLIFNNILDGKAFGSKTQVNSAGGQSPNAPTAKAKSALSVIINNGCWHFVYEASTGLVDAFQLAANHWTFTTIVRGDTNYKSFEIFEDYFNSLMITLCGQMGSIDVLEYSFSKPYWSDVYMSKSTVPAAAGATQVGTNQFGSFISYVDTNGKIQCVYRIAGGQWGNIQIGGAGAGPEFATNAPAGNGAVGVGVYKNIAYHVCYITTTNQVYDVFWAGQWADVEMYPTLFDSQLDMSKDLPADAVMLP